MEGVFIFFVYNVSTNFFSFTIQIKTISTFFEVLFIMSHKVVLIFESVD